MKSIKEKAEELSEDFVSFETAKLLKEKGFDVKCDKCYAYFADDDIRFLNLKYPKSSQLLIEDRYPCITLQMAMKWLREVHRLFICVEIGVGGYAWNITNTTDYVTVYVDATVGTYEKVCEAAIKYCLENII